ncbi:MAG TPA: hypothetical protein VKY74_06220 [Chloroflexia bacterium]|nr:hypothetical protein [Chloroflexia bacterium]
MIVVHLFQKIKTAIDTIGVQADNAARPRPDQEVLALAEARLAAATGRLDAALAAYARAALGAPPPPKF